jgi:flagellar biosynthesis regulator FlbT
MSLKVVLKPRERVYFGTSRILVASDEYVTLIVEGDIPVIREAELVDLKSEDPPERQIYYYLQRFYMSGEVSLLDKMLEKATDRTNTPEFNAKFAEALSLIDQKQVYRAVKLIRDFLRMHSSASDAT